MMRLCSIVIVGLGLVSAAAVVGGQAQRRSTVPSVLDFTINSLDGKPVDLARYQGRVVLMVNVASECGYTPQYAGLQALHKKYAAEGLSILGFPANEFGAQEPGTNAQIAEFCRANYGVEFDMFSKIVVRGNGQHPLYRHLTSSATNPKFAGEISWNFEKFLVGRDGQIIARFLSATEPLSNELVGAIKSALAGK